MVHAEEPRHASHSPPRPPRSSFGAEKLTSEGANLVAKTFRMPRKTIGRQRTWGGSDHSPKNINDNNVNNVNNNNNNNNNNDNNTNSKNNNNRNNVHHSTGGKTYTDGQGHMDHHYQHNNNNNLVSSTMSPPPLNYAASSPIRQRQQQHSTNNSSHYYYHDTSANHNVVMPVISIAKTINQLLHNPSNRCCADCRSSLVDSSLIHASFRPRLKIAASNRPFVSQQSPPPLLERSDFDFGTHHRNFAPPPPPAQTLLQEGEPRRNSSGSLDIFKPKSTTVGSINYSGGGVNGSTKGDTVSNGFDRHSHHGATGVTSNSYVAEVTTRNPYEIHLDTTTSNTASSASSTTTTINGKAPPDGSFPRHPNYSSNNNDDNNPFSQSAPASMQPSSFLSSPKKSKKPAQNSSQLLSTLDPALLVHHYVIGHGVFLCAQCAQAHKLLGESVTIVRHVQQYHTWTAEEALLMKQAGGNTMSWKIYEAYIEDHWKIRRPNHASTMQDRYAFCKAKYEAMSFVLPDLGWGPWCDEGWMRILQSNQWAQLPHNKAQAVELQNMVRFAFQKKAAEQGVGVMGRDLTFGANKDKSHRSLQGAMVAAASPMAALPERLIDYFCVVGSSGFLDPRIMQREFIDLSTLASPEDVMLEPRVIDCFPPPKHHKDVEFPEHVATFVLPEGCCPSDSQKSPFFFTFVLTEASGHRLYGGCLRLYDEAIETQELRVIMEKSGYAGVYPPWLPPQPKHPDGGHSVDSSHNSSDYMDIVYLPKCLVVLSHYPFFDLFRNFLLQLYRITLVEAPLPIERFISNFCCEVPLPPQGKVEVKFGFTVKDIWSIQRPPENQLPLASFSYKPIFACLSVGNIITLVGCLMAESRVALCSRHYSLLTPVSEALLSFLFPLQWQGMYIPIMPYAMLDILDAPVPFLVGIHSRYLLEAKPDMRPQGVIYVDLDRDIIHLGYDEDSNYPRLLPSLPEKGALKLRGKLEEHGACLYLQPDNAKYEGNTITNGHGQVLPDHKRESYATTSAPWLAAGSERGSLAGSEELRREKRSSQRRRAVLRAADRAYQENELLTPITGFLSEQGQLYNREPIRQLRAQKSGSGMGKIFGLRRLRSQSSLQEGEASQKAAINGQSQQQGIHGVLLDLEEPPGFNSKEVRNAFLRFFVSLLKSYEQFINNDHPYQLFRVEEFLADLNLSMTSYEFVRKVVRTQMFQRFLEERQNDPCDPLFLFFDECIIAKQNRSKRLGRQRDTPFLDDPSGAVKETFTPPPPSNWGLPDDGRSYQYGSFPKLNHELFGKTRSPMRWPTARKSSSLRNLIAPVFATMTKAQAWQQEILARSLPPAATTSGGIYWAAKQGMQNLESAIGALSHSMFQEQSNAKKLFSDSKSQLKGKKGSLENFGRGKTISPKSDKQLRSHALLRNMSVTTLRQAENVVLNTRRFTGIILAVICKLQSHVRKFIVRRRYLRFLKALRFLQYKWRRFIPEGLTEMDELEKARRSVIVLQRSARKYVQRLFYLRKLAAIALIQRWFRGALCRARIKSLGRACKRIQTIVRSRRAQYGLQLIRMLVAKVQARCRGYLTRQRITSLNERRMSRYREQIFLLWKRVHTPLSYRTKFWPYISDKCGFLRLRIAESELERLWIVLEVDFNTGSFTKSNMDHKHTEELRLGKLLGITDHTYWRYLKVQEMTGSVLLFPAEERRNTELRLAADRVEAERIQIYERVSASAPKIAAMLVTLYGMFKIDKKDKHKKFRLAELAWTEQNQAHQSEQLMMHIFPELEEASNIIFNPPSKKTLKRFRNVNTSPPRLGRSHWAHSVLKDQISRNVREVAVNALQSTKVLSSRKRSAAENYVERQYALLHAPNKNSRKMIRREVIDSLLENCTWEGK